MDWQRLKPRYWLQTTKTDLEWDAILNDLLDRYEPISDGYGNTVKLGNIEVWTGSWPYAYGIPYSPECYVLPTVATRKRLRGAISKQDRLADVRRAAL